MPEITVIHIAIIAGVVAVGAVLGWIVRGNRCAQEKVAVNEGWQHQLEAQRTEHERLLEQNKTLMEQISQFQASGKDATNRARELSQALKETFTRRDELQRELKEIRSNLEVAVRQRDKLHSEMQSTEARGESAQEALRERDEKIFRLSRELDDWQGRLPPLLERYRERDDEAARLEDDLAVARDRIEELENLLNSNETRIEPVDPEALGDELDASNDPSSATQTGIADAIAADEHGDSESAASIDNDAAAESEAQADDEAEPETADEPEDEEVDTDSSWQESEQAVADEVAEEAAAAEESAEEAIADEAAVEAESAEEASVMEETDEEAAADEAAVASAEISELHDRDPGGLRDNLKLIKGVGPAIEKTLNELGIFRFHQIAEMSEYDIDRVAQRLKGFRTRIYREDWIGQARDLQLQKSGT